MMDTTEIERLRFFMSLERDMAAQRVTIDDIDAVLGTGTGKGPVQAVGSDLKATADTRAGEHQGRRYLKIDRCDNGYIMTHKQGNVTDDLPEGSEYIPGDTETKTDTIVLSPARAIGRPGRGLVAPIANVGNTKDLRVPRTARLKKVRKAVHNYIFNSLHGLDLSMETKGQIEALMFDGLVKGSYLPAPKRFIKDVLKVTGKSIDKRFVYGMRATYNRELYQQSHGGSLKPVEYGRSPALKEIDRDGSIVRYIMKLSEARYNRPEICALVKKKFNSDITVCMIRAVRKSHMDKSKTKGKAQGKAAGKVRDRGSFMAIDPDGRVRKFILLRSDEGDTKDEIVDKVMTVFGKTVTVRMVYNLTYKELMNRKAAVEAKADVSQPLSVKGPLVAKKVKKNVMSIFKGKATHEVKKACEGD